MRFLRALVLLTLVGCASDPASDRTLFEDVAASAGITFRNDLSFTEEFNPYTYRNFYNGAGVAIGDLNNDGLLDIYFAGNQADNKLYINTGNWKFTDVTAKANVACAGVWATGVTLADVNADGWLDIYVCKSGAPDAPRRYNELFINNGDLTFTERAAEFGLDIVGLSVQAAFFDYDKDGDLDCYLLTNSIRSVGNYDLVKDQREIPDAAGGGNKFLINDNGKFRDYSKEAGIYRSDIGFGLGITLGDFNDDSWTDIFVSNDFFERDYLYINDGRGAFRESLTDYFSSISMGSMGADFADLNGDAEPELFVTEMLPDSLSRRKTKTVFENWDKYQLNVQNGYYHQFPRNVLQTRLPNGAYAEVGRMAGVAASEWSWGALLFDMDGDGLRDVFVANGIYKDLLDRDFLTYVGAEENVRKLIREEEDPIVKLIELMPTSRFSNYAYRNLGDLRFDNAASLWGLDKPMFSTGSAYGDLDNDGDLDLVVNNVNGAAAVFRNNSDRSKSSSLTLTFNSQSANKFSVGTKVIAYDDGDEFFGDNFVTRGFQSSVQPRITISFGKHITAVDSVVVQWPQGATSVLYNVPVDTSLTIKDDSLEIKPNGQAPRIVKDRMLSMRPAGSSVFRHHGSKLVDFNRERLLPMMYSNEIPRMARGDIDGDGTEEIYIGGGREQPGAFLRIKGNEVEPVVPPGVLPFSLSEETQAALFDADSDGDLDLYMATGGRSFPRSSSALQDRIMINNGRGNFTVSDQILPVGQISTSTVVPIDVDNDKDLDLFIGERFDPFTYGYGGRGYLLENSGGGVFKDITAESAPMLESIGMVTDGIATDLNGDGWTDLVIVGDWMPVVALVNHNGIYADQSSELGFTGTEGWWHEIESADFNQDGKPDFVIGNHGLNSFFRKGDKLYVNDFDHNGSIEQIYCTRIGDKDYPVLDRDELVSQLPGLKKKLLYYKDYGAMSMDKLFDGPVMAQSRALQVKMLASMLAISGTDGYELVQLPKEAQYSPIYAISISDFDDDGIPDVVAGGNQFLVKPQFGRFDASSGWFFKGIFTENKFQLDSGIALNVEGQIRDIEFVIVNGTKYILFAKYDDNLEVFSISD